MAEISLAAGLAPDEVRRWCLDEMAQLDQEDAAAHQRWLDETPVTEIALWVAERKSACEQWLSARVRTSLIAGCDEIDDDDDD